MFEPKYKFWQSNVDFLDQTKIKLIDFNGTLTYLGAFYTLGLGSGVHYAFIFTFFVYIFLRGRIRSNRIRIILKQIYFTHRWDFNRTPEMASWGFNGISGRGVRSLPLKKGALSMIQNCIWGWGSSNVHLESLERLFMPLLPAPLLFGVVVPDNVLSMWQIGLFENYSRLIESCVKTKTNKKLKQKQKKTPKSKKTLWKQLHK